MSLCSFTWDNGRDCGDTAVGTRTLRGREYPACVTHLERGGYVIPLREPRTFGPELDILKREDPWR